MRNGYLNCGTFFNNKIILSDLPLHGLCLFLREVFSMVNLNAYREAKRTVATSKNHKIFMLWELYIYVTLWKAWWKWALVTLLSNCSFICDSNFFSRSPKECWFDECLCISVKMEAKKNCNRIANDSHGLRVLLVHWSGLRQIYIENTRFKFLSNF